MLLFSLFLISPLLFAQDFIIDNAVIESVTGDAIGGESANGELENFFVAQKKLVYGILKTLNIPVENLPIDIKNSLQRFDTTNFEAFKMFSFGLDAMDMGEFVKAKNYFKQALEIDPNFELAGNFSFAMPNEDVRGTVELQTAVVAASRAGISTGKAKIEVDLSGAIAALQAGQNVVIGEKGDTEQRSTQDDNFTSNEAGS
ncbi:MAG: hypothetical protein HQL48_08125, partial [Gammaproteobacteria bacterium]|nr:hypothetical protein [Gammaproteobacteria bacterium]